MSVRRETVWFSKAALLAALRYTAEHGLGEPPSEEAVEADPAERFPAIHYMLLTACIGNVRTFYRCGVEVHGDWYRVAVTPEVFELLPKDVFDLPF
jgi:hypothetical protein